MKYAERLREMISPRFFNDEEKSRMAIIQSSIAVAIMIGLALDMGLHFSSGSLRLLLPMGLVCLLVCISWFLVGRGALVTSGSLMLWTLLAFLTYLLWIGDGIHDTAILAYPAALASAGLIFRKKHFFVFTTVALLAIALTGAAEIHGLQQKWNANRTDFLDIVDLMVILGITTVTMRLLTDGFQRSLVRSQTAEAEVRDQAEQLKESEIRFRTLFEAANDAILIMREDLFIDCNSAAMSIFGCVDQSDIAGHSPWEFSPPLQPDGSESRQRAMEIVRRALSGVPQRFRWKHRRPDGTLFDADVSLSRLEIGSEEFLQAIVRDITEGSTLENRLRESEEYYKKLVETSPDAIVIVDKSCHLAFASKRAFETFRVPNDGSVMGQSITEWITTEDHNLIMDRLKAIFERRVKSSVGEFRLLRHDRTPFWCEIASSPLDDMDGQVGGILLICRDVSERRKSADELRESEERFARLSDAAFEGIVMSENGFVVDFNEQFASMLGYKRDEMVGLHVSEFVPPESLDVVMAHIKTSSEEPYEHLARKRDGSRFPVTARAKSLPYRGRKIRVTAIRDISESKRADELLRLQSAALQTAGNAIVIADKTGLITYVNSAFTKITGYTALEVLGKNPRILKSGKQSRDFYAEMWSTIKAGRIWQGELINMRKDGSLYSEEMTIAPVENDARDITHFIAIKNDITEKKRLQEQLMQAQKMEAIGTLAGGIAHDFNNILGIILAQLSMLPNNDETSSLPPVVETISKAVQRGANLVNQILTFAKKAEVVREPVNLNALVLEILKMIQGTFPKNIEIVMQLADKAPVVSGDHTQLVQAVLNLCINARDAMEGSNFSMPGSKKLTVITGRIPGNELKGRFGHAATAEYASITVSDTGCGIDAETKKKIFEPFFTTKVKGKGTGLGLAVVYGIIETHHGFIDVTSEPGAGTSFSIYLPDSSAPASGAVNEEIINQENVNGTETVLVAEDEPGLLQFLEDVLTANGYRVLCARDGFSAVEAYDEHWHDINLVISDLGLPKLNGEEVFSAVKAKNQDARVIIASGFLEPRLKAEMIRAGVRGFLPKPYNIEQVLSKIREVLDGE